MTVSTAKLASLKDLFGADDLSLEKDALRVGTRRYPILEDVIILLDPVQYTADVRKRLALRAGAAAKLQEFAEDVQFTFGSEWTEYDRILPEHEKEFAQYFDLVDLASLAGRRVCDLGCGIGRWSYFLKGLCRERVLVDWPALNYDPAYSPDGNELAFASNITGEYAIYRQHLTTGKSWRVTVGAGPARYPDYQPSPAAR